MSSEPAPPGKQTVLSALHFLHWMRVARDITQARNDSWSTRAGPSKFFLDGRFAKPDLAAIFRMLSFSLAFS